MKPRDCSARTLPAPHPSQPSAPPAPQIFCASELACASVRDLASRARFPCQIYSTHPKLQPLLSPPPSPSAHQSTRKTLAPRFFPDFFLLFPLSKFCAS